MPPLLLRSLFGRSARLLSLALLPFHAVEALTFNYDVNTPTSGTYVGTGVAPDSGTYWNAPSLNGVDWSALLLNARDSTGATTDVLIVLSDPAQQPLKTYREATLGNPQPLLLMQDYAYGATFRVIVANLPPADYQLYVFAHGDAVEQKSTVTLTAAHGGASASTGDTGTEYRNLTAADAEGRAYLFFDDLPVGDDGLLEFRVGPYFNGFQLVRKDLPVLIATPPSDFTGYLGLDTTLTVEASSAGELSFQWEKSTDGGTTFLPIDPGSNPSAATAALVLPGLAASDAGVYRVAVSTLFGSVTSPPTELTVVENPAPLFSLHPRDRQAAYGEAVTFSSSAFATAGVAYQWYHDGVEIPGATNPTLVLDPVFLPDVGIYTVVASNALGATTSEPARLGLRLPAFPGADGPGSDATGGRGGEVYYVTSLEDLIDAPPVGSLRHALKDVPPEGRTVVFEVSGLIRLEPASSSQGWLKSDAGNLTIAGESAPAPGITITGHGTKFSGRNVVLRHLKMRPGVHPVNPGVSTHDAISNYLQDSIIDHVSLSWADDELLSSTDLVDNTTVQYALIGEGLFYALSGGKTHAYGALINSEVPDAPVSYHHNLFAHVQSRLPRIQNQLHSGTPGAILDWTNNVIYNWQGRAGYSGSGEATRSNFIGNYYIAGANTRSSDSAFHGPDAATRMYARDNYVDRDKNGVLDGADPGNAGFFTGNIAFQATPFEGVPTPKLTPPGATLVEAVARRAGAFWWDRDAVDARLVEDTLNQTGQFLDDPETVGGWDERGATRPPGFDRDRDGMPDAWELAHGLNPLIADPHGDDNADGYTNLQNYLHDLGAFPMLDPVRWEGGDGRYADPTRWYRWWKPSRFDEVAISAGTATIDSTGNWAGTVILAPTGGESAGATVESGWWQIADALETGGEGEVLIGQSGGIVRIDGRLQIASAGANARYRLTGGILFARTIEVGAGGHLELNGGWLHAAGIDAPSVTLPGTVLAPGTSPAVERLAAALSDRALVPPVDSTVGATAFSGDLDLAGATLEIGLEGESWHDTILVEGTLQLGGTLRLTTPGTYRPSLGSRFTIARAGALTGAFAEVPSRYAVEQTAAGEVVVTYLGDIQTYDDWAAALPFASAADRLAGADPEDDGWSNEEEYAFDGDPLRPDRPQGLPRFARDETGALLFQEGVPLLRFSQRRSSDLTYSIEVSDDLESWSPLWSTAEADDPPLPHQRVPGLFFDELSLRLPPGEGGQPRFARVRHERSEALLLVAPMGVTGSSDLPPDVAPSLVFNRPVKAGTTGTIRLHEADGTLVSTIDLAASPRRSIGDLRLAYHPVTTDGRIARLVFDRGVMAYGKTYYVEIDPGVILEADGEPWAGIDDDQSLRFTTRAAGPSRSGPRLTVSADGRADFCTVQGALEHLLPGLEERVTIEVAEGAYEEIVYLQRTLGPVTIRGASREGTVLHYANNANFNSSSRASFRNRAHDLTLENLTLYNSTPKGGSQAEAFLSQASRVVVRQCNLVSFQDTIRVDQSAYFEGCHIEGDVDYVWGDGVGYFDRCTFRTLHRGYLVQARNEGAAHGFIFRECTLVGEPGAAGTYLARIDPAAYPQSEVVFLLCAMDDHIAPAGWRLDGSAAAPEVRFFEYGTVRLDGSAMDVSGRLPASTQLDATTAAPYFDLPAILGFDPAGR
jgi:hypothetical protein